MRILDGKALAKNMKEEIRRKVDEAVAAGRRRPGLAVLIVGDDPGSRSYVAGKAKDCEEVGFAGSTVFLDENISEEEVLKEGADGVTLLKYQPKKGVIVLKLTGSLERGESFETYQSIPVEGKIDGKTRVEITLTDKEEK